MKAKELKIEFEEKLLSLPTLKERIKLCGEEGKVYLGKGQYISKEDYHTIIVFRDGMRYGDKIYEGEEE